MKLIAAALLFAGSLFAQLPAPNASGVAMGHLHFNSSNVEAHKKFWVGILGAHPAMLGTMETWVLPDVVIAARKQEFAGGTDGSVIGHVGVKVKNLEATLARCREAGITVVSENKQAHAAFVNIVDDVRVEMIEDATLTSPTVNHHIHYYLAAPIEAHDWYAKFFGAKPGKRANFDAADLPGVNLTFSKAEAAVAPTKGRALDHIGFEVRNLEAFTKKLEAQGIKLEISFRAMPNLGITLAFLVDPWGTRIELTEGMNKLR